MKLSRIFKKTLLLAFLLFGVISILTSVLAGIILHEHMTQEYVTKGRAIARSIANSAVDILLNRDAATIQSMIDDYLEISGAAYVFVEDASGQIISHTFVPSIPTAVANLPTDPHGMRVKTITIPGRGEVMDISKPILDGMAGYAHVGMDMELIKTYVWKAIFKMQGLMAAIFLACAGLLYAFVGRLARPLGQLTAYAEKLSARDFSARIDIDSQDEIGLLAGTMQFMAGELSGVIAGLERSVASATRDLTDTLAYLTAIIDNMADGLLVADVLGRAALSNPALSAMFALPSDPRGRPMDALFSGDLCGLAKRAMTEGKVISAEIDLPGGRVGKAAASPIVTESDHAMCLGAVLLIRDVSYEKELDRMKTEFISTVSHELRTPMTSILGFAKIIKKRLAAHLLPLAQGAGGKAAQAAGVIEENLDIIVSEGRRLTELINDVLDIAKMESGKVEWRDAPLDPAELATAAAHLTRGLFEPKGLTVAVRAGEGLPRVTADRDRIIQVLVNLISNAVKFTPEGGVTVEVGPGRGEILYEVRDTGLGIAEKDLPVIFERFKQAGDTLTGKPQGTGLGLPICKQIVERHGGRIWAESKEGEGSAFFFTLPLVREPGGASSRSALPTPSPRTAVDDAAPLVLVTDDDPSLRRYLCQALAEEGYRTLAAGSGPQALDLARRHKPDLVTMDLMMPGMDGAEAIRRLREDPQTRHLPVVVITALPDGDRAGGDAALGKPVDEDRLLDVIRGLLGQSPRTAKPCLFLGPTGQFPDRERTLYVCPGRLDSCTPEAVFDRISAGFAGTVFVPAPLACSLDLDRLSRAPGVQVVILPAG